jgi:membrane complex biogenesis BtpA family protein
MNKFNQLFQNEKPLIGMIHIGATPGTYKYGGSPKKIISQAIEEAGIYKKCGIRCVMIENMHDIPYLNRDVGHEVSTLMSIIGYEIKEKSKLKCGIQILAGADKQALASAHAAGLDFMRTECYVFSHIADEGTMNSNAGELRRYQKHIGAENILIFTDIKKKHSSHAVTSDVDVSDIAEAAQFFLSDGVILTGKSTGMEVNVIEAEILKSKISIPVLIGSGITLQNIMTFLPFADAFIIGSYFKEKGVWSNKLDKGVIDTFVKTYEKLYIK